MSAAIGILNLMRMDEENEARIRDRRRDEIRKREDEIRDRRDEIKRREDEMRDEIKRREEARLKNRRCRSCAIKWGAKYDEWFCSDQCEQLYEERSLR
jgi:hypothetical protein